MTTNNRFKMHASVLFFAATAFCLLIAVSFAQDQSRESKELYQDDYYSDRWRAVEPSSASPEIISSWIPSSSSSTSSEIDTREELPIQTKKRRRIRKRKRRPFVENSEELVLPRRRRPQRLDEFPGSWNSGLVEEDSVTTRPYHRRRVTPSYSNLNLNNEEIESVSATLHFASENYEDENETFYDSKSPSYNHQVETTSTSQDNYEYNESADKSTKNQQKTKNDIDLKSLLKKSVSGVSSLSEVLQQKNLSLSDLINGRANAISILTETTTTELPKYKTKNQTKIKPKTPNDYLVEDTTTERRIFVPSHPKYYTSLNYKPHVDEETLFLWSSSPKNDPRKVHLLTTTQRISDFDGETTSEETTTIRTTTSKETAGFGPKKHLHHNQQQQQRQRKKNLPMTSAKMLKNTRIQEAEATSESFPDKVTILPENAFKISLKQIFGFNEVLKVNTQIKEELTTVKNKIKMKEDEGPMKMSMDLNKMGNMAILIPHDNREKKEENEDKEEEEEKASSIFQSTTSSYVQEKLRNVTAKDEVMDILSDNNSKERLSRILKIRNMTIEDLVQLRERGSSQLHLADIFHNSTKEPEPKLEEVHEGSVVPSNFEQASLLLKNRQAKSFKTVVVETTTATMTTELPKTQEPKREREEKYAITSFPTYQIKLDKNSANTRPFQIPVWKTLYPGFSGVSSSGSSSSSSSSSLDDVREDIYENIPNIQDFIENNIISEAANEHLNIELTDKILNEREEEEEEKEPLFNLPQGVQSAILASLAIVGLSLVIFLTILVIFRWSQKTKRRFCYASTLSCSKIKSPILSDTPKRSLRDFMVETLGRRHYKQTNKQSMTDTIWDQTLDHRKPFQ